MGDVFTNNLWENWEKSGRQEFIRACETLLKNDSDNSIFDHTNRMPTITSYVLQLIDKGIKGVLKKEAVILALQELVSIHADVASVICDVLNVADGITSQIDSDDAKDRANFCSIVKDCEKFLSEKLLKERLEIETLQEVGILKNRTFYSKFIKIKTKLYYKQRKFNLFREECEGFAKLQTELNKEFNENTSPAALIDIVHSLIGCFNLDPNRVLDIILESFENKTKDAHIFVPLIELYIKDPSIISEVLSTKLAFLKNTGEDIPASFFLLVAYLLQHSLISLDHIYSKLSPDEKEIKKHCEKALKDAAEYVRKLQIISINNKEKEDDKDDAESVEDLFVGNEKLRLCEALLSIGDWGNARTLINLLPKHFAIGFQPIALSLCNLLHALIEPVYSLNCALGPNINRQPVRPYSNPLAPKAALTFTDLKETVLPMLICLGSSLHYDSVLLSKTIRLFRAVLQEMGVEAGKAFTPREDDGLYFEIISILDETILPSLSYLDCNCCIAEEIWNLVKFYPYQIRYCLYARWKNDTYSAYPPLMKKRGDAEKQIKNIMKRVSKENVKPVGRLIGKLTHCSPGFLFDYVLLQIQVYSNLINPVVDSLKYLTNLSYDVLGYCVIENLCLADKKRVKHDSTSISMWLQSLSVFSGAVYKKYSIELTGLLQYVANQLKAQKSLDLFILKEVVQKMAGVEPNEDSTMEQLYAMSGGEMLKGEAGYFSQIRNTKRSSLRLKEAMNENDLAVALCLLMAQQNYCVVYRETQKSHLKLVGKLSDQCQDTLVQFGTFLGSTLTVEEYINKLPTIQCMLLNYHIPTEVAFFLARPMFNHSINQKYDQLRKADPNYKKMSSSIKIQKYYDAVKEVMQPVHSSLLPLHSPKTWEDISPQFLATFWSLTMYDLCVPEDIYQQVINKAKQQSISAVESLGAKGKKEQERHLSLVEKLMDEKKKQSEHVEKVLFRLKQEKSSWFLLRAGKSAKTESITRFLQLCLFPRCTFTQIDAVYCAKFVHTIHMLKTENFSTLLCYDRLFCDVTYSIISCTENEALRYGRFLFAMLETVMKWHKSKETFEKECSNYPGFMTKYRVSNHTADSSDNVGFENYRHVCHKWHYKLAKAVVTCLESKDYVQIRNSLIILIKIIPFFPVLIKLAQFLEKRIEKVRDEEKNNRQDLFTLAISYLGQLKQRLTSGQMMKEGDFHIPVEKDKVVKPSPEAPAANGKDLNRHNGEPKEKVFMQQEKKPARVSSEDGKLQRAASSSTDQIAGDKERREDKPTREDQKDKYLKKEEAKRNLIELERDVKRNRIDDRELEDRNKRSVDPKEDRYIEIVSPKEERYSIERQDRFYEERSSYYHKDISERDNSGSSTTMSKHVSDPEPERDIKRRKVDVGSAKAAKYGERKVAAGQLLDYPEKIEKKERSASKRREKLSEEDKELKKDRKLNRKRDRLEESLQLELAKRRREEEKAKLLSHQNGEKIEISAPPLREKHHRKAEMRETRDIREISPQFSSSRERSHERSQSREKQYPLSYRRSRLN
ncbi:THO complex subunit 2 isoform X1 [Dendroctonus ponderosae]|uniref:THO complex subunit 2 isoform X1 n=1 Tax=Dendroctonus ponderosae TaxID=77166 RepID=UPI002035829D|nr:THO complex subunit 2 isoform X1 [Dendroctonus ponderosae]